MKPPLTKTRRPWIAVNMAMTADGKVSGPRLSDRCSNGDVESGSMSEFGSPRDHHRMLKIRASMDAVICGRNTVEQGAVDLGPGTNKFIHLRKKNSLHSHNKRIIVSASGKINPECLVFQKDFSQILIVTTESGKCFCEPKFKTKPWVEVQSFGNSQIDWNFMTGWLKSHWGIDRMVLEGGGQLNDAFFRHQLVDEIFLTICPWVFGGKTNATISDGIGVPNLIDAARFECVEHRSVQGEMFLRFQALKSVET